MNEEIIAKRELNFKNRVTGELGTLVAEIYKPYLLKEGAVDFTFAPGTACCPIRFKGIQTKSYDQETYGADTMQALNLATDIDTIFKRIDKDLKLFFKTGEAYFE